jgi:hypothetical protein
MPRDANDISRTFSQLVEGEMRERTRLKTIDDTRAPKQKSPVLSRLAWLGESTCPTNNIVKLVAPLILPANRPSVPFDGLAFFCDEFGEGDESAPYAIAMGPLKPAVSAPGTLTTRSDDDTGTLTMDDGGHGIATGAVVTLLWDGGSRGGVAVGTVAGVSVPIDGGSGDVLPATSTAVRVVVSAPLGYGVLPEAYWAKLSILDAAHTYAVRPTTGTLLQSAAAGDLPVLFKETGTGEKWAVVQLSNSIDRKVGADSTDGVPRELIGKLANTGVYNPSLHQPVYAQLQLDGVGNPPDNLVRLFTALGEGSEEVDRFRIFELTERKLTTDTHALARWLSHDLEMNLAEAEESVSDPLHRFAGAAAGYAPWASEMLRGMRGIAERLDDRPKSIDGTLTTRTDDDTGEVTLSPSHGVMTGHTLDVHWDDMGTPRSRTGMTAGTVATNVVPIDGGTGDNLPAATTDVNVVNQSATLDFPLWKIVAMEGFAAWLKGTIDFDDGEEIFQIQTSSVKQDHGWDHVIPVSTGGIVPLADDNDIYTPYDGDKVLALLDDPDTDPPTYRVFRGRGRDRRSIRGQAVIASGTGDGTVTIDAVVATENGFDPTAGNPALGVVVVKDYADAYAENEQVEADWIESVTEWHARRKGGSGAGGIRLVYLAAGTISGATNPASYNVGANSLSIPELVNNGAGVYQPGSNVTVYHVLPEAIVTPSGRWRVGIVEPDKIEPTKLVLISWSCATYPEPE